MARTTSFAIRTGRLSVLVSLIFRVIAVHIVWGDAIAGRQAEVMELAEVYQYVQEANGVEDDVLLVGDFNTEPDDTMAYSNLMTLPSMTQLFQLPQKSHIRDSSLYDNIFFQSDYVTEYLGRFRDRQV